MNTHLSESTARSEVNFTLPEMKFNTIDSMAVSLDQLGSGTEEGLRIDCGQISEVDANGLQLLYILLQCLRFRGFEPELVNLSDSVQRTFQKLGFRSLTPKVL